MIFDAKRLWIAALAMGVVVLSSNILVQYPVDSDFQILGIPLRDLLTWGAFTYPFAFLVTDLTNRRFGAGAARRVVLVGFAVGILMSVSASFVPNDAGDNVVDMFLLRIAGASAAAFLLAQLLDVLIFDWLRQARWWMAPLVSSAVAAVVDTFIFFGLAFAATDVPWVTLAIGDLNVKWLMVVFMLLPFRGLMAFVAARRDADKALIGA